MNATITTATKAVTVDALMASLQALGLPQSAINAAVKAKQAQDAKDAEKATAWAILSSKTTRLSSFNDVEVDVIKGAELFLMASKLMDWKTQVFKDGSVEEGYYLPLMFGHDVITELTAWFTKIEAEVNDPKVFAFNQNFLTNFVDTHDSDPEAINRRALSRERGTQK